MTSNPTSATYQGLVETLKKQVLKSQSEVALFITKELVHLYYHIGLEIMKAQHTYGWGSTIIEQLSIDLHNAFPHMKGFSPRNLRYMKRFAEEYEHDIGMMNLVVTLPWGHNILLLERIKKRDLRLFYIQKTIEHGWSRTTLDMQISNNLHNRQGQAITNFKASLPAHISHAAYTTFKDPYIFDFLNLGEEAQERAVEVALVQHMEKFILELGSGFAFVGRQYHLEVGGQDFYLDLLFYHLTLRCFIVIELKDGDFKPEYAGKVNFYLSAVDEHIKHQQDNPSIGLILCKNKNNVLAEYALRDMSKPIGLAAYLLTKELPEDLQAALPTIEELEMALDQKIR